MGGDFSLHPYTPVWVIALSLKKTENDPCFQVKERQMINRIRSSTIIAPLIVPGWAFHSVTGYDKK